MDPNHQRCIPFRWVVIGIFSFFLLTMAMTLVIAYTKRSGNTGIDSSEIYDIRERLKGIDVK